MTKATIKEKTKKEIKEQKTKRDQIIIELIEGWDKAGKEILNTELKRGSKRHLKLRKILHYYYQRLVEIGEKEPLPGIVDSTEEEIKQLEKVLF